MKKRSELKRDIQSLERENQRLRDIIAVRGKPLLAIIESKWFGVRHVSARVSADGENWAIIENHMESESGEKIRWSGGR